MASSRIFGDGTLTIGADEISVAQTNADLPKDAVVLQVNGVPITVNPESMLLPNEMASTRVFAAGTLTLGSDEVSVAQKSSAP